MSDAAVFVEELGKRYSRGRVGAADSFRDLLCSLSARMLARGAGQSDLADTFWALQGISFEVGRGDVVGIIGRNGAGKSTLLKILSRITTPTTGRAVIAGRLGSLLEVGTGFHPELTGRENVLLNGAVLGMRKGETLRKLDQIIEWSGVSAFIDVPVKRYSSGMRVRLAFSVAAHLEAEILIVDEVLAVGDAEFQQKCLGKMGEVARDGRTVLFVSHNMTTVLNLCRRGIVLEQGRLVYDGAAHAAVQRYTETVRAPSLGFVDLTSARGRVPSSRPIIRGVGVRHRRAAEYVDRVHTGDDLAIDIHYECGTETVDVAQVTVATADGHPLLTFGTHLDAAAPARIEGSGVLVCEVRHLPLNVGEYDLTVRMTNRIPWQDVDCVEAALRFEVQPNDYFGTGLRPGVEQGPVAHKAHWNVRPPLSTPSAQGVRQPSSDGALAI